MRNPLRLLIVFSLLTCSCLADFSKTGLEDTQAPFDETVPTDVDGDSDTETDTGSAPETGTDTGSDSDTGTDTGSDSDTGTDTGSDSDTGTDTGSDPDTGTDTGSDSDTGTDTGSDSDTGTDTGSDSDTGTDSGSDTDTGTDTGSDPDTGTDTGSDPDTGTDTGSDSDTETDSDDECPDDPNKVKPGECGCGVPEGTCGGLVTYADTFTTDGGWDSDQLDEISGLSLRSDGGLLAIEQRRDALIYLDPSGVLIEIRSVSKMSGAEQEAAAAFENYDILANVGNNYSDSCDKELVVYNSATDNPINVLFWLDVPVGETSIDRIDVVNNCFFVDVEGVAVHPQSGDLFLFAKRGTSPDIWRLIPSQWQSHNENYSAVRAEHLGKMPKLVDGNVITGAAFSPWGNRLALTSYNSLFEFNYDFSNISDIIALVGASSWDQLDQQKVFDYTPHKDGEFPKVKAVAYTQEGDLVVISEAKGYLYRFAVMD